MMNRNLIGAMVVTPFVLVLGAVESAHADDYWVDPSGAIAGSYTTVQAALDAVPSGTPENRSVIRILPGTYTEKLTLAGDRSYITLLGTTSDAADTVLTFNLSARSSDGSGGTVGTSGSASSTLNGDDFLAANLTFANSTPDRVAQAVALKTQGDRMAFRNCRFIGFQDTLYVDGGEGQPHRVYFKDSFITGDTDFIFGRATAVFDNSVINSSDRQYITASRTEADNPYGFVFLDCVLTGVPNPVGSRVQVVPDNTIYLGRPWQWDIEGTQCKSVFINTRMGPHIAAAGWDPWSSANTDPASTTYFAEYHSMDLDGVPLDVSGRVSWSHQLTDAEAAEYTVANVLGGDDGWDPLADLATIPSIPEPGSAVLFGLGAAWLAMVRRQRRTPAT